MQKEDSEKEKISAVQSLPAIQSREVFLGVPEPCWTDSDNTERFLRIVERRH